MTERNSQIPDVLEHGAPRDGQPQTSTQRLYMQLVVLETTGAVDVGDAQHGLIAALDKRGVAAVVYEDLNHPSGLGVLSFDVDPAYFTTRLRPALAAQADRLRVRTDQAMIGRSYSTGFEPNLADWLLERPRRTVLNPDWGWAIWYPLRRSSAFERLDGREKGEIMREHGQIGRAYGDADLAHDVRLACHGLDPRDNDFLIGLIGRELHPLSHVVQAMRRTRQTAEYITSLGPFFVGRVVWRSPGR